MKLNKIYSVCFSLLFFSISIFSQEKIDLSEYQKKYPGSNEVVIQDEIKYIIKEKSGALEVKLDSYYESLILGNRGISNYTESFYESELSIVESYDAYTITKGNDKIYTDLLEESGNTNASIFYDNVKEVKVTYKGLEPGARKVLSYTTEFLDPNLLHRFIFKKNLPLENARIIVECDKDIELGYKMFNNERDDILFTKEEKRKKNIYTWERKNVEGYEYENGTPGFLYTEPHLAVFIKSYDTKDGKKYLLNGVKELYKYYSGFTKDLNKETDEELVKIAKDLIKDLETEEEKVKALYYWVKDNIKYIAYENGYEGFIPREASLICERKFGDCKDMASILTALCQAVDIDKVKLTWIGTRELPYGYEEMPTPGVDNHMIAAYLKEDEVIFLDGTDQHVAYPLPSSFIQGKEALIGLNSDEYLLKKVPIVDASQNLQKFDISIKIEEGVLKGSGKAIYNGMSRVAHIRNLSTLNEKRRFESIKRKTSLGNNKYILNSFTEENVEDRDMPYIINYDFDIDNYLVQVNDEIYVNLYLKKMGIIEPFEKDRTYPYEITNLTIYDYTINLELDNSSSLAFLPENVEINNDVLFFNCEYVEKDNQIQLKYKLEFKQLIIEKESFEMWNESMKKIKNLMKENITIKTK